MQQKTKYFNLIFFLIFLCSACHNNDTSEIATNSTPQQLLEEEKQKLELQKKSIEALKSQLTQQTQQLNLYYPSQVTSNNIQIQNLTDILDNLRLAEKDVADSALAMFREQNAATQIARDQIAPGIFSLQQSIQQTQQQIYNWTNTIFPLTSEQSALLKILEDLLISQKQQLENLNEQKLNISEAELNQIQLINNISQMKKTELINNQVAVQEQILYLRAEIEQLESTQLQLKMSLNVLDQQLQQAQKDYNLQAEKIVALEKSLKTPEF